MYQRRESFGLIPARIAFCSRYSVAGVGAHRWIGRSLGGSTLITEIVFIGGRCLGVASFDIVLSLGKSFHLAEILISPGINLDLGEGGGGGRELPLTRTRAHDLASRTRERTRQREQRKHHLLNYYRLPWLLISGYYLRA